MAGFRGHGPICSTRNRFDFGTLALSRSPSPGPTCSSRIEDRPAGATAARAYKETKRSVNRGANPRKTIRDPIIEAFRRCEYFGWLEYFEEATKQTPFDPALLMAIAFRESSLDPKYLKMAGDHGNGYGLMQVDIRSHREWVQAGNWRDAKKCIHKGAEILNSKYQKILTSIGRRISTKSLTGGINYFIGANITEPELLYVAVAAYNCGMWSYYHYSKGNNIDAGTTNKNYSTEVMKNCRKFRALAGIKYSGPDDTKLSDFV